MVEGGKVVQQRKLLFLEKLFASLLLGAPKIKAQLNNRVAELQTCVESAGEDATPNQRRLLREGTVGFAEFAVLFHTSCFQSWLQGALLHMGWPVRRNGEVGQGGYVAVLGFASPSSCRQGWKE